MQRFVTRGGCRNNHVLDDFTLQVEAAETSSNKAALLSDSGVPGKGLSNAPGLQGEFNENSKAADRAGKKK